MAKTIQFTFNNEPVSVEVNGNETLLSVIRSGLNFTAGSSCWTAASPTPAPSSPPGAVYSPNWWIWSRYDPVCF